ncbi:hypothetical protein F4678DRAFT_458829 [Xylaria arbuscula]|nr:hypothetical protein F4678DRAFT_458829 [Xylaria arbuscula]
MASNNNNRQAFATLISLVAYAFLAFAAPGSAAILRYRVEEQGGCNSTCAKGIVVGLVGLFIIGIGIRGLWAFWKKRRYRFPFEKHVEVENLDSTPQQQGVNETSGAALEGQQK